MKIKITLFIFLLAMNLNSFDRNNLPKFARWVVTLTTPLILNWLAKNITIEDDGGDEKIILPLASLSCGNNLATFDQVKTLDPKLDLLFLSTIKNALSLYITSKASENLRSMPKRADEKQLTRSSYYPEFLSMGLMEEAFVGRFTKYLLIYKTINLVLTNLSQKIVPNKLF